jgi:Xaa-Pro aminopeptidase
MVEAARPGADAAVVYTRAMARMMELGSEHYPLAVHIGPLGGESPRFTDPPLGRRLRTGDYITNETSAVWGGQLSQEDQPILLGPIPDDWKGIIDLQREVFEAGLEFMKPGTAFADLIDFVNGFGEKRGLQTLILMHGRGIGDDNGPLLTPRARGDDIRDVPIERGNIFVFKPYAMRGDEQHSFVWGGDVVVTERGAERLFRRQHGLISVT